MSYKNIRTVNNKTRKQYGGEEPKPVVDPAAELDAPVVDPADELEPPVVDTAAELDAPVVNTAAELDPTVVDPQVESGEPIALEENLETSLGEPYTTDIEPMNESGFGEEAMIPIVESSSNGESIEIQEFRNRMEEYKLNCFYLNTSISTEQNKDKSYKREGVLHFTDSVTVTGDGHAIMSLGGVIGDKGIETAIYDKLRNVALQKVSLLLAENQRCYNTRLHFERNGDTIFVHIYGTLYAKKI